MLYNVFNMHNICYIYKTYYMERAQNDPTKIIMIFRVCVISCISATTDYGYPMKAKIKDIWKIGPMWQTKYALAVPKNLGLGFDFWPWSEGNFLNERL